MSKFILDYNSEMVILPFTPRSLCRSRIKVTIKGDLGVSLIFLKKYKLIQINIITNNIIKVLKVKR